MQNTQLEALEDSPKFRRWRQDLVQNGLIINKIDTLYTRHRHNGEALFGLVYVHATTPEGDPIPPLCFVKGQVVSVLIALTEAETGKEWLLLVRQRRICDGSLQYEHVAGMVDANDSPLEVAIRESEEEAGMQLRPEQLIALNDRPYFPTTATSDEAMWFFACELTLPAAQIHAMANRDMGVASEHEHITTVLATPSEAMSLIHNVNGRLLIFEWQAHRQKGSASHT